jgi:hypothetical protein
MTNKKLKIVTTVHLGGDIKLDIKTEDVVIRFCSESAAIPKKNWYIFLSVVNQDRYSRIPLSNNVFVNTMHSNMVYFERYDSFSGVSLEDWEIISSKVTELLCLEKKQ